MNETEIVYFTINAVRAYLTDPSEGYVIRLRAEDLIEFIDQDDVTVKDVGRSLGRYNGDTVDSIKITDMGGKPTLWKFSIQRDS